MSRSCSPCRLVETLRFNDARWNEEGTCTSFRFVTERASKLSTDPQQQHFAYVSHGTEYKSCVWPNNIGVKTACALGFSRSDPYSLEDTSKCKLMFTVLLAFCLKQGLLKPFTHVPHTIFFFCSGRVYRSWLRTNPNNNRKRLPNKAL